MNADEQAKALRDALRYLVVAHGALEEHRRPCGTPLSMPHAYALLELLAQPEGMTVSELAERLSIDRTNVSRLCAKLEQAGEISRGADPADGRARNVRLTRRGKQLARQVDAASTAHFARLAAALGGDTAPVVFQLRALCRAMSSQHQDQDNP